jgi:hypothetical protein
MSNPYTPGSALPPGGAVPPDLAKKAGNIQLMGIIAIVCGLCCCGPVGIILGVVTMVQAPPVLADLARMGNPAELVSKVNTGKICGIIGLVLGVLNVLGNLGYFAAVVANS